VIQSTFRRNRPPSRSAAAASAAIVLAACLAAPAASAHAVWFAQRAGQLAFIFGLGADDESMVERLSHVTAVDGYDSGWKPVATQLRTEGPLVVVNAGKSLAVVTAAMDYGLWSKLPNGHWVAKGRDAVPNSTLSERNYKYAVRIVGPLTTPVPALPNQVLEVVPVGANLPALKGQPLRLRVLFHGKPIAGVKILRDFVNDPDGKGVTSGADGTLTIRVRNQGLNVFDASYDGPAENPRQEDRIDYEATLSFVLPHKPE
jgi:nickel transport protein